MRAVQISEYGSNEVVNITAGAPAPEPGAGQVLVEVHAAGVNPSDWKIRQGLFKSWVQLEFPATLGGDFSGVVVKVGGDVTNFHSGDEVFGRAGAARGGSGSFAELLVADVTLLAAKPTKLNHIEAAAVPLVGVSAWQALVEHIELARGHKLLIHGGAGGIGSFAIQLAKHVGAYVATTVSSGDVDYVRALGVDEVIDYQTQSFETMLRDFDAVFDCVGGETFAKSFVVLKHGGVIVSMAHPQVEPPAELGLRVVGMQTDVTIGRLAKIAELLEHGVVKIYVDKVFSLAQAKEALTYMETGRPQGKVVLQVV